MEPIPPTITAAFLASILAGCSSDSASSQRTLPPSDAETGRAAAVAAPWDAHTGPTPPDAAPLPTGECPAQAGQNPRPADCDRAGQLCTVRDACGICVFEENCDYYSTGPAWEYADPLQNTGRARCPPSLPALHSPCSPDFMATEPLCEYCDGATPALRACLEGAWRVVTRDYCSL